MIKRDIRVGQYIVAIEPTEITTTLGSCVAVCLFDPEIRVGGMNHFSLAGSGEHGDSRYGQLLTDRLYDKMVRSGAAPERIVAKIFGGAHVIDVGQMVVSVSEANVSFIRAYLEEKGLELVARDVGGASGRQLKYRTDTGMALVKKVDSGVVRGSPRGRNR